MYCGFLVEKFARSVMCFRKLCTFLGFLVLNFSVCHNDLNVATRPSFSASHIEQLNWRCTA